MKITFRPCDPKWPQIDNWPHNIGSGSNTNEQVWVLWSCCFTWANYSIFSENDPMPQWPLMTPDWNITPQHRQRVSSWCTCASLMVMLCNISYRIFLWKSRYDLCDPKLTQIDIWPHNIGRGSQGDQHVWVLWSCYVTWMSYSMFSENNLLTPLTPNDPGLTFDSIK